MRWIKRIILVLIAVLSGLIGFILWSDERSQQAYFNARPIAKSLRAASSRNGPHSVPLRDAFLKRFPMGSDMGKIIGALAVEGFNCLLTSRFEAAQSQMQCTLQESPDLIIVISQVLFTLHLSFDKANRLEQVRVDQFSSAL
jgi:hypothetical protein